MNTITQENIPQHIAIIMDGNGRWAQQRSMSRTEGHRAGVKRVEEIVDLAQDMGIKVVTFFTFSTENWNRPENEIDMLMSLISAVLKKKMNKLKNNNMRFQIVGRRNNLPESVLNAMNFVTNQTKNNTGLIINLAFNYGGRSEILDAVKAIAKKVEDKLLTVDQITEDLISQSLYTCGLPDPDLLIRTSGEKRISNFLLWQLSYAEFYFTEKYWPDFDETEFRLALKEFQHRHRRFGRVA